MPIEINSKSNPLRTSWNKGRLVGQKRSLCPKEVWAIRVRLQIKHNKRDLAMFNLAIDSKLRGCDLVSLRVDDIAVGGHVRDRGDNHPAQDRPSGSVRNHGADSRLAAGLVERATGRSGPLRLSEPSPESTSCDSAPIRARRARLDRGGRDGQQRLRHAFDAPHQGGADLPQDRQSASGPVASRNGYIVPTNSRLKLVSATGSTRASAKWCR